jgi:hypothetical protein
MRNTTMIALAACLPVFVPTPWQTASAQPDAAQVCPDGTCPEDAWCLCDGAGRIVLSMAVDALGLPTRLQAFDHELPRADLLCERTGGEATRAILTCDYGPDGISDAVLTYELDAEGRLVRREEDTNANGTADRLCHYEPPCPPPFAECFERCTAVERSPEAHCQERATGARFIAASAEASSSGLVLRLRLETRGELPPVSYVPLWRERVWTLRVAEPQVYALGSGGDISVELPGLPVEQHGAAVDMLTRPLEGGLYRVHEAHPTIWATVAPHLAECTLEAQWLSCSHARPLRVTLPEVAGELLPTDSAVAIERVERHDLLEPHGDARYEPILVVADSLMGLEGFEEVATATNDLGRPFVSVTLDAAGAERLCEITTEHTGSVLVLALDGRVISAPLVEEPICGGSFRINPGSSGPLHILHRDAVELAEDLRAAAHPPSLSVVCLSAIGPPAE